MSKKIGLNQGWYLRVAASLALVVAIVLPKDTQRAVGAVPKSIAEGNDYVLASTTDRHSNNCSDVKTQESPWDELKTVTTSEVKQKNTTTDTKNKAFESLELGQKQITPTIIYGCYRLPNCDPLLDNCWICEDTGG